MAETETKKIPGTIADLIRDLEHREVPVINEQAISTALAAGLEVVLVPDMARVNGVEVHHRATGLLSGAVMAELIPG